jgi:hypothetical protein
MGAAPKAFITYSHKDKKEREELRTRLAVMENKGEIEFGTITKSFQATSGIKTLRLTLPIRIFSCT